MTETKEPSAVGVYDDLENAERTLDELRRAGFSSNEIGIIGHVGDREVPVPPQWNEPEMNATEGFVKGGLFGAIIGLVVILAIPGLGHVAGQGLWFDLVGGIVLGAVLGSVLIALSTFVFMRRTNRLYAAELEHGRFVVTVKNPQRKDEAISVLKRRGMFVDTPRE
jgi:hypothetical protein